MNSSRRYGILFAGIAVFFQATSAAAQEPQIHYEVRYHPPAMEQGIGAVAEWEMEIAVSGLKSADGPVEFYLEHWGHWEELDAMYFELQDCTPKLNHDQSSIGRWVLRQPKTWNGKALFRYRLRLTRWNSMLQQRYGLLPTFSQSYSFGYSRNTLAEIRQQGEPVEGKRIVTLRAPKQMAVVSGWSGRSTGKQEFVCIDRMENGPIAFGDPSGFAGSRANGRALEVFQFGRGRDITDHVSQVLEVLIPAMSKHAGFELQNPFRAFITDTQGGGMGSDRGLRIGFFEQDPPGQEREPYFVQLIAHELFHFWLGITLEAPDSSLVWLYEGFTDYIALWETTANGLLTEDHFAGRLMEYDKIVRSRTSLGQVSFADPSVRWRDGDGPNEQLAYVGGALLAFQIDVALRKQGHSGILQFIHDSLAAENHVLSLDKLQAWLHKQGLDDLYRESIAGKHLPDTQKALLGIGYEIGRKSVDLAYVGIQVDQDKYPQTIIAVDPEGPAKNAGIQVGDVITGYFPVLMDQPRIGDVQTPYRFGLNRFQVGRPGETYIGVIRDDRNMQIFLDPEPIAGGFWEDLPVAGKTAHAFFTFTPDQK